MSDINLVAQRPDAKPFRLPRWSKNTWMVSIALLIYVALSAYILKANGTVPRFDFDPSRLMASSMAIKVHAGSAILTLIIGIVLMFAPKGFKLHRTLGWTWVATMALTAGSSFLISSFTQTYFSPIHALSAWTLIGLPMGIAAVRRRKLADHRKKMPEMFVGGMVIAGMFSFLPGRLMWDTFFS